MKYIVKIRGGGVIGITQEQRDKLATILLKVKGEQPVFVEIGTGGPLVATASIDSITEQKTW